jgi:hypothetical protein
MIRLLPNTDPQILSIIPREYIEASDLELVIKEDGTKKNETLSELTSVINGNFLDIECTFSILTDESSYSIEIKQGSTLLYRDKIYCTSQIDDTISHTLNTGDYEQYDSETEEQQYIII